MVEGRGGAERVAARQLDADHHVDERILHALEGADGAAELLALDRVASRHLEGGLGAPHHLGGERRVAAHEGGA